MNKKIEDYLHLYLGCEVRWTCVVNEGGILVGISKSEVEPDRMVAIIGGNVFQEWYIEETKPILRPLSDMTEVERRQCDVDCGGDTQREPHPHITHWARRIDWLLKRHFDLFRLIESGLALDATKHPKENITHG